MIRLSTLLGIAALSAALAWAGDAPRTAPPFEVQTSSGAAISIQSLRGKVVLLEFFLTECSHCQRTAGDLEPIYKEWRPRGLEVVSVAINPDAKERIPEFVRRFGVTYPIGLGNSGMIRTFGDLSAVMQVLVPYIFIIDRRGAIRHEHPGGDSAFFDNEAVNLRTELDTLLKESAKVRKAVRKPAPKT